MPVICTRTPASTSHKTAWSTISDQWPPSYVDVLGLLLVYSHHFPPNMLMVVMNKYLNVLCCGLIPVILCEVQKLHFVGRSEKVIFLMHPPFKSKWHLIYFFNVNTQHQLIIILKCVSTSECVTGTSFLRNDGLCANNKGGLLFTMGFHYKISLY